MHGGHILSADDEGSGIEADGILTQGKSEWIGVVTADCLPLVLVTPETALALHVSRKTLVRGLLDAVPTVLPVAEITNVWIGPHICAEHFTFDWAGEDIVAFQQRWPEAVREEKAKLYLSLRDAVQQYLTDWGVPAAVVQEDGRCTFETLDLPSYRRALARGARERDQWLTAIRCS